MSSVAASIGLSGGYSQAAGSTDAARPADASQSNPLQLGLSPSQPVIKVFQTATFTMTVNSNLVVNEPNITLEGEDATTGWHPFDFFATWHGGPSSQQSIQINIYRNTLFRLHASANASSSFSDTYSPTVKVYVEPAVRIQAGRLLDGRATVTYIAQVYAPDRFRHQLVYFYVRHSRHERYARVGAARLRYAPNDLRATSTFSDARGVQVLACVRHPVAADLGPPFSPGACGRPTLARLKSPEVTLFATTYDPRPG